MQLTRLISSFLVLLTFGLFALAGPAATKRASDASVQTVLTGLQAKIAPSLTAINATNSKGTNGAAVVPMINQVITDLNNGKTQLTQLSNTGKRQTVTDAEVALTVAELISAVTYTVNTVADLPLVKGLLPGLDFALDGVLVELGFLVKGVLKLVGVVLVDVAKLLDSIGLGLVLGLLGI